MSETQTEDFKRLYWACRRGMLELDMILIPFMEKSFHALNAEQKKIFESLLKTDDPSLYAWLMGQAEPDEQDFQLMIRHIRGAAG